jgi:hypothetical protein
MHQKASSTTLPGASLDLSGASVEVPRGMTGEEWDGRTGTGRGSGKSGYRLPTDCREKHPLRAGPENDLSEKVAGATDELQQHEQGRLLPVKFRVFRPVFLNPYMEPYNQRNRNRGQEQLEPKHGGKDLRVDNGLII